MMLLESLQTEPSCGEDGVTWDKLYWVLQRAARRGEKVQEKDIAQVRAAPCCWQMFASFSRSRSRVPVQQRARYPAWSYKPQQSAQVDFPPDKAL